MAKGARVVVWCGAAALAAVGIFAFLAQQSVTVEDAAPNEALRRFAEIRSRLTFTEPMLQIDATGRVTRRNAPAERATVPPTRLRVLAYRAPQQRLVRADVPFWFLKVKGPAVRYALRDTGFDLDRLGVSPADLARYGVCLIVDQTRKNGDRLLVWTE